MIDRFYPTNAEFKKRKFNGGNIMGVIEKLDYIQGLGMNGILLTPFYQTNEYHGYHITDYDIYFVNKSEYLQKITELEDRIKALEINLNN